MNVTDKKKVMRWAIGLLDFNYTVEHIAGRANIPADFLSRHAFTTAALTVEEPEPIDLVEDSAPHSGDDLLHRQTNQRIDEVDNWEPISRAIMRRLEAQSRYEA
jgi:hypothetical protein